MKGWTAVLKHLFVVAGPSEIEAVTIVDMPDRTVDLLFRFLNQNGGKLSRRAREREFAALTDQEIPQIEQLYEDVFEGTAA